MISVDEALQRILASIVPLEAESIALSAASGRIASEDIKANIFNPAFDVSAMDGYAVRAEDVKPGVPFDLIGTSQAGARFSGTVGPGKCVRIFTGAPVPEGANAVIMQEEARAEGETISFDCVVDKGRSIRFRGEDFEQGQVLVRPRERLTPQKMALVAAGNNGRVSVTKRPSVALLATGDELVLPGNPVGPDQIVSSNTVALSAFFAPHAHKIADFGIVGDDREHLGSVLATALQSQPDILITTGGASVGEHDFVQEMLMASGVDIDFWRIAMRPGKPLMFGRHGRTLIFGLPGNPVSALVTARLFVLPAVLALCSTQAPVPMLLPLSASLSPNGPRRHFLRGRLITDSDVGTMISPIAQTDSGHLSSLASADGLIEQHEHCEGRSKGDLVKVHLLR